MPKVQVMIDYEGTPLGAKQDPIGARFPKPSSTRPMMWAGKFIRKSHNWRPMIEIVVKIIEQNNQMTVKIQWDKAMNDLAKPLKIMGSRKL